jgi:hypothetical protein
MQSSGKWASSQETRWRKLSESKMHPEPFTISAFRAWDTEDTKDDEMFLDCAIQAYSKLSKKLQKLSSSQTGISEKLFSKSNNKGERTGEFLVKVQTFSLYYWKLANLTWSIERSVQCAEHFLTLGHLDRVWTHIQRAEEDRNLLLDVVTRHKWDYGIDPQIYWNATEEAGDAEEVLKLPYPFGDNSLVRLFLRFTDSKTKCNFTEEVS